MLQPINLHNKRVLRAWQSIKEMFQNKYKANLLKEMFIEYKIEHVILYVYITFEFWWM